MSTSGTTGSGIPAGFVGGYFRLHRGETIAMAIIGLVLGILALVFPGASLLTVAILFGSYLIAAGIYRITLAFIAPDLTRGTRWFTGILGVLVVIAGIFCLANPFSSLFVLAIVIGIGWIIGGVLDLTAAATGAIHPRWFGWVTGIVAILAGIATFMLPGLAVSAFVMIAGILLIVVGITTLFMLPRHATESTAPQAATA